MRFSYGRFILWTTLGAALLLLAGGAGGTETGDVIGVRTIYKTREQDTLLDVARAYDLGYIEIRSANPAVDPWLPAAGRSLVLPTQFVLPDAPRRGIVINLAELRLYYFSPGNAPRSFPIGIGGEGFETPVGRSEIAHKRIHPTWYPTRSERDEDPELPAVVPPGPDNPMGDYALYLAWRGYAIHGTNRPYSIGRRDSHGCIRMYPEDIETLFKLVQPSTKVAVVNQPVKLGWLASELYLEIHPEQADAESLETKGVPRSTIAADADDRVVKAAGNAADRLDWYAIHLAETQRSGIATRITLPASGL